MENINILFADDDKEIRQLVKDYFEKNAYSVKTVSNGKQVLDEFKSSEYNLVILDLMMPKLDGIEVCKQLRDITNIPIVMLTAKDSEIDKVLGLKIGADDYITKPFLMTELLARVEAHLRRFYNFGGNEKVINNQIIEVGQIKIDLNGFSVFKRNNEINLTTTEYEILKLLMLSPGKVYTKKQIFNNIWQDDYLEADNNIMVHIRRLREKIEDNPQDPKYIKTVWGIGYKFNGDLNV